MEVADAAIKVQSSCLIRSGSVGGASRGQVIAPGGCHCARFVRMSGNPKMVPRKPFEDGRSSDGWRGAACDVRSQRFAVSG